MYCFGAEERKYIRTHVYEYYYELHSSCSSANITRLITSYMMNWTGHAAYVPVTRNPYKILAGRHQDHLEDLYVTERTGSKWILDK
jgi:hypothetical protein